MKKVSLMFGIAVMLLVGLSGIASSYNFPSALLAEQALTYEGNYGNECKIFVQNVVAELGETLGTGYGSTETYTAAGVGGEVTQAQATRGDVIQISNDAYPNKYYTGMHTAIVLENDGSGTFRVVDSNFTDRDGDRNLDGIVTVHDWTPVPRAELTVHFYRLGTEVGFYSNGWRIDGNSQTFLSAYLAYGSSSFFGAPWNNPVDGGDETDPEGKYVHLWGETWVQDFWNEEENRWSMLLLNEEKNNNFT